MHHSRPVPLSQLLAEQGEALTRALARGRIAPGERALIERYFALLQRHAAAPTPRPNGAPDTGEPDGPDDPR